MPAKNPASATVEARPHDELGETRSGGLAGRHHFCFASYQRPDRLEWGGLRALHFYTLRAGERRAPSFHAGFEIVTLVTAGALRRLGSFDPRQPLLPGSVELISTGVGADLGLEAISEGPASFTEIWIASNRPMMDARRQWLPRLDEAAMTVLATGARAKAPRLCADAELLRVRLPAGGRFTRILGADERAYLAVETGDVAAAGARAGAGDALAIRGPGRLRVTAGDATQFLFVRVGPRR
ncbi:MAG TPA: hypothetical protein VMG08_09455 [Allosphingosinicella sp.]|nr:hypothetical protein [Allosphingosinicella sp.]